MKGDTLLLADVFKSFRNKCLETHELDPAYFSSLPGLAREAYLKMTRVELELLTDPNMLLMIEVSHGYVKANNKYIKNYDRNKTSSFLTHLDANNLYGCPVTEKLPIGNFKWVKNVSKIDEELAKNYDENGDIGYFLKVDHEYPEELHDFHIDLTFLTEKNGS